METGIKFEYNKIIEYSEKSVISKVIVRNSGGNVTLFSFDKGEGLSEHSAPFDALVQIIDGKADIMIDGKSNILEKGDVIIMPANHPHALKAVEKFKMLLTMIKAN